MQMGPNAVKNPAALIAALKTQQGAPNPTTPAERLNPDQQVLEHIKAAQVSLDRAKPYTNDPHMLAVFDILSGTLTKALLKFDGSAVLQSLREAIGTLPPSEAAGMGAAQPPAMPMGMGGAPPAPMGGGGSPMPPHPGGPL